jgi:hypothetical protein
VVATMGVLIGWMTRHGICGGIDPGDILAFTGVVMFEYVASNGTFGHSL